MLSTTEKQLLLKSKLSRTNNSAQNLTETVDCDMSLSRSSYPANKTSINKRSTPPGFLSDPNIMVDAIPNYLAPLRFKAKKMVDICLYQIVMNESQPLLLYLVHNRAEHVSFPTFPSAASEATPRGLLYEVQQFIKPILPSGAITYVGHAETATRNVLILQYVNYTNPQQCLINIAKAKEYIWVSPVEIMNGGQVCNKPASKETRAFFFENAAMACLRHGLNGHVYANPVIGYYCSPTPADERVELIDIYREQRNPAIKKCYYFSQDLPAKKDGETIMRAALFLGRTLLYSHDEPIAYNNIDSIIDTVPINRIYMLMNYSQHLPLSYH
jgi:hypothetical protein